MREEEEDEAPLEAAPRRMGPGLRAGAMAILVLVGGCLGGAVVRWVAMAFAPDEEPPAEVLEVRPTPNVIVAVRDLARLESASFHVERVIDLESRQRRVFGLVEAEDSILLVAAADVVAGVDLSQLRDTDVVIDPSGRSATITLPPVEIFSARLDNDRTYVHTRETDLLARRRESLETRARREAERTLQQAAIDGGIIARAERNAARTVETLIRSLGFDVVTVRFRAPED
ncbi:MAG: DUF4230 domain-containing protein [Myxococcota bacterium]|nr:DUF4230 domain-containing protein [Myxococcota bacterium]